MGGKVVHRIQEILDHYELSNRAFDLSIGMSNGYIGKQILKEASMGSDALEKILQVYPEISPGWLISGEGEMLRKNGVKEIIQEDYFLHALLKYLDNRSVKQKIISIIQNENNKPGFKISG